MKKQHAFAGDVCSNIVGEVMSFVLVTGTGSDFSFMAEKVPGCYLIVETAKRVARYTIQIMILTMMHLFMGKLFCSGNREGIACRSL